jgi:16S rRNA (uracil1498-N3)-methyltransferase
LLDEVCQTKHDFFTLINNNTVENFKKITIFIGPEGGISNNERNFLLNKGFVSVTAGKNILRTETAAIASMFFLRLYQNYIFNR